MTASPTPHADLNGVLHEFVTRNQAALGDNFIGAYLQGSLAVGDFDQEPVTGVVTVQVVDIFKIIHIQHGDRFKEKGSDSYRLE